MSRHSPASGCAEGLPIVSALLGIGSLDASLRIEGPGGRRVTLDLDRNGIPCCGGNGDGISGSGVFGGLVGGGVARAMERTTEDFFVGEIPP